jgi:hypothetical protein
MPTLFSSFEKQQAGLLIIRREKHRGRIIQQKMTAHTMFGEF